MAYGRRSKKKRDKRIHDKCKAEGICMTCKKAKAEKGLASCKRCRKRNNRLQRERHKLRRYHKQVKV